MNIVGPKTICQYCFSTHYAVVVDSDGKATERVQHLWRLWGLGFRVPRGHLQKIL